jgi:crossover junction endodeoxyribonuclease RusA
VNNLFFNVKHGRVTSAKYADWQKRAWEAFIQQPDRLHRHTEQVAVIYTFGRPDNRRRDLFNLEKALSDFLVKQDVLADDSLIHRGTVQWGDVTGVMVEINPL